MSQVWLITGATPGGVGYYLAQAALAAGHKVIATSRNPDKSPEAVAEFTKKENAAWVKLDVTSTDLEQRIDECVKIFGRVDVLMNNAGFAVGGAIEDTPLKDIHRQMETNYFGPIRMIQGLIPHMRERGSGTIINVTSSEGIGAAPGIGVYASSKFALEAISEALQGELAAFGIRTLLVEPGGTRTNMLDPANAVEVPLSGPYKDGIVEYVLNTVRGTHGQQMVDPERLAKRIVECVTGGGEGWPEKREQYLRLMVGKECVDRVKGKIESLQSNLDAMKEVGLSCDFDS